MKRASGIGKPAYWLISIIATICGLLVSSQALGDTNGYVIPSVAVGRVFDSNVLLTADNAQADQIWRISPAVEAGIDSREFALSGYYGFDIERYHRHTGLDSNASRRQGAVSGHYDPTSRLSFSLNGYYTDTNQPQRLSQNIGLQLGRVRARIWTLTPASSYAISPLTTATLRVGFTDNEVASGPGSRVRTGNLGLEHRIGAGNTLTFDLGQDRFDFGNSGQVESAFFTAGFKKSLNPRTRVSISAGTRSSNSRTTPEASASIHYALESGDMTFSYVRSQTSIVGQTSAVNFQTMVFGLGYDPTRSFSMTASPAYSRDWGVGTQTSIYSFGLTMSYLASDKIALLCSYQYNRQTGHVGGPGLLRISDRVIYVGVVFSSEMNTSGYMTTPHTPLETLWKSPDR